MGSLFRTGLLIALLTAIFMAIGYWVAGIRGASIALAFALAMNFLSYWNADRIVLSLYGARQVTDVQAPRLLEIVRRLALQAGLPVPRVYLIDSEQPNAFATGRNPGHAAVVVTRGLLGDLSEHEIVGVLAHELSHIKRYDTLIMTISAALAGAIGMLANFLLFFAGGRDDERNHPLGILGGLLIMLLAPLAASLVQLAISRTREFVADKGSAEITGQPLWLAEALIHIHQSASHIPNREAEHNPATAHLFIVNPLGTTRLDGLFSTHPPVQERVARLRAMSMTQRSK